MPAHNRTKGIPLNEAPYYFAPARLRGQYDNPIIPPQTLTNAQEHLAEIIGPPAKRQEFKKHLATLQGHLDINSARSHVWLQMRDRLLDAFGHRKLVVYGILLPRTRNSVPEKVPDDLLQHHFINWGKSSIKQRDFEYVSVSVYKPEWTTDLEQKSLQIKSRPLGRPSSKKAIIEAIRTLLAERKIPTGSRKNDYELIGHRTAQMYPKEFPDNKGLSDKTIAKYLAIELHAHPTKRSSKL